jgi:hypothetical protein
MSVQLSMLPMMMSEASLNATGSRDLEAGANPCVSPDGLTTNPSGQDHLLASHSAPQGSSVAAPTSDTSPHTSPSSSPAPGHPTSSESKSPARLSSESLQRALEARLQANLNGLGSMIYSGVWKMHTTPAGRQIYRLRASARRTSVSEHSSSEFGWPTPSATDHKGGYEGGRMRDGKLSTDRLDVTAQLTTWPDGTPSPSPQTATQTETDGAASEILTQPSATASGQLKTTLSTEKSKAFCTGVGWNTPRTADGRKHTASLEHAVKFADGPARLTASGEMLTGSSAEMESGGQLNPRFSGWLMGYPPEWCEAAISCQLATPSRKKAKPTPDAP